MTLLIEKISCFKASISVEFSKLAIGIALIEKKSTVSSDKISKSRSAEFDFENPQLKSNYNSSKFSITALTPQLIEKSIGTSYLIEDFN